MESDTSRSVSWLFAAKCFRDTPTPFFCTPFIYPIAICAVRYGSSEKYSKFLPPRGLRFRFTPGPSRISTSASRHSPASASPICSASPGSQEQARAHPIGKQVAGILAFIPRWSDVTVCFLRPFGPSVIMNAERPIRSFFLVVQKSAPDRSSIFSSIVRFCSCPVIIFHLRFPL